LFRTRNNSKYTKGRLIIFLLLIHAFLDAFFGGGLFFLGRGVVDDSDVSDDDSVVVDNADDNVVDVEELSLVPKGTVGIVRGGTLDFGVVLLVLVVLFSSDLYVPKVAGSNCNWLD
jgi:hypothetical protein